MGEVGAEVFDVVGGARGEGVALVVEHLYQGVVWDFAGRGHGVVWVAGGLVKGFVVIRMAVCLVRVSCVDVLKYADCAWSW